MLVGDSESQSVEVANVLPTVGVGLTTCRTSLWSREIHFTRNAITSCLQNKLFQPQCEECGLADLPETLGTLNQRRILDEPCTW